MKNIKIACILIAIGICIPLFENAMFSFFKHNPAYLFETGQVKSCLHSILKPYQFYKPLLYLSPFIGLIVGIFVGSTAGNILIKLIKDKEE